MAFDILGLPVAQQVTAVYVAYFGRAPDPVGLNFWIDEVNRGINELGKTPQQVLDDISESFRLSEEAQDLFPVVLQFPNLATEESIREFVGDVFQNLFNRDPEPAGEDFWTGVIQDRIDAGINIGDILIDIIAGAQNTEFGQDATTIGNKIEAGNAYASLFANEPEALWTVEGDIEGARQVVAGVDETDASVEAAEALAQQLLDENVANSGEAFTLTSAADNLTPDAADPANQTTDRNDSFDGVVNDGGTSTFDTEDTIDAGGGDQDRLEVRIVDAADTGTTAAPDLAGIERVFLENQDTAGDTFTLDTLDVDGVQQFWSKESLPNTDTVLANVDTLAPTFGLDAARGTYQVNFDPAAVDGGTDALNVAATNGSDAVLQVSGGTGATQNVIETVALSSLGTEANTVNLRAGTSLTSLTVTGAAALTLVDGGDGFASLATVDASGLNVASPGLDIDLTGNDADLTFTGGNGDDRVVLDKDEADGDDSLDGKDGTADIFALSLDDGQTADLANEGAGVSNFEVFELVSAQAGAKSVAADVNADFATLTYSGADTADDSFAFTGLAADSTLDLAADADTVSAAIDSDTDADSVTAALAGGIEIATSLVLNGFETVALQSDGGSANTIAELQAGAAETLGVTGDQDLTLTSIADIDAETTEIDAEGFGGDLTIGGLDEDLAAFKGGDGRNDVTVNDGNIDADAAFSAGAGTEDALRGTVGSGAQGIVDITGFETVALTSDGDFSMDFRNAQDIETLRVTDGGGNDIVTLSRLNGDGTGVELIDAFASVALGLEAGTVHDVTLGGTDFGGDLSLDDAATTLNVETADNPQTIDELDGVALTTVNVTGDQDLVLGGTALADTVTTVDAGGAAGALTVDLENTSGEGTLIGGAGNDTLTGSAQIDQITGGPGSDVLDGDGGADEFVWTAEALDSGDVAAGDEDSLQTAGGSVQGGEIVNFATGVEDALLIGGEAASALGDDTDLGDTFDADNNIVFVDAGGGNDLIQIDLNGDQAFNAADDFQITINDADDNITGATYNAENDWIVLG